MMVTDLRHLLDLPPEAPGSARRLAQHLGNIVRSATAGDAIKWHESGLILMNRHHGLGPRAGNPGVQGSSARKGPGAEAVGCFP